LSYYRDLIRMRKSLPQLKVGRASIYAADKSALLYTRGEGGEVLVALNLSQEMYVVQVKYQWRKFLLQTQPGDARLVADTLYIAPLGGAVLSR